MSAVGDLVEDFDEGSGLLRLTIDREKSGNCLTLDLGRAITGALAAYADRATCVIIGSKGQTFCSGADLNELAALGAEENEERVRDAVYSTFQGMIRTIAETPAPVIARVQGPALGAGADLVLACDIRIAATSAWLEQTWIRLGAVSALGGAFSLVRALGHGAAMDVLLTGRRIEPDEAHSGGLYQRVVSPTDLDREVDSIARAILTSDRGAVTATKRLVMAAAAQRGITEAMEAALTEQVPLICRPEFSERVMALISALKGSNG